MNDRQSKSACMVRVGPAFRSLEIRFRAEMRRWGAPLGARAQFVGRRFPRQTSTFVGRFRHRARLSACLSASSSGAGRGRAYRPQTVVSSNCSVSSKPFSKLNELDVMAFLRTVIRCSLYKKYGPVFNYINDSFAASSSSASFRQVALKSTAAIQEQQQTNYAKDPLDVTFEDAKAAFKSKTTYELLRAYVVYTLCSIETLVENNMKVRAGPRSLRNVSSSLLFGKSIAVRTCRIGALVGFSPPSFRYSPQRCQLPSLDFPILLIALLFAHLPSWPAGTRSQGACKQKLNQPKYEIENQIMMYNKTVIN